jgi:hypothetical protein
MNRHRHSRCHYKQNSGFTPAGMNNLHIGGPPGRQTPVGSPPPAPSAATTTSAPGGQTAAGMTSGQTLLRQGPRPRPHSRGEDKLSKPKSTAPASAGRPQSAPAGPHSRPRHENENGTVPEHEYRPRSVRRVVRPPVRLATVARTEDGMLHPGWAAAVRLPRHGWRTPPPQSWRMVSTPRCRRKKRDASPREGRPRLASPSSPQQG